jgi:SPP1 gp7 family putative phage head morphogenesis protein
MTDEEKRLYALKWHRFETRYEAIYTTKFTKALKEQVAQFAKDGYITAAPIYKVLVELYTTVGPTWSAHTGIHRLKQVKALAPMGFNERIVELMRQYYGIDLINDAELMTRYSREVIADVLSRAALSGASLSEVVTELLLNPEFSAMRARRIARTETVTAANGAAMINAKEKGFKLNKEWIAIEDKRTRHSHRNVDGTIIHLDDAFNVNGTQMEQPGVRSQPNGLTVPASEVVNCRCVVAFIPVLDKRGLPIRI